MIIRKDLAPTELQPKFKKKKKKKKEKKTFYLKWPRQLLGFKPDPIAQLKLVRSRPSNLWIDPTCRLDPTFRLPRLLESLETVALPAMRRFSMMSPRHVSHTSITGYSNCRQSESLPEYTLLLENPFSPSNLFFRKPRWNLRLNMDTPFVWKLDTPVFSKRRSTKNFRYL